jgi:hypothetical protein
MFYMMGRNATVQKAVCGKPIVPFSIRQIGCGGIFLTKVEWTDETSEDSNLNAFAGIHSSI